MSMRVSDGYDMHEPRGIGSRGGLRIFLLFAQPANSAFLKDFAQMLVSLTYDAVTPLALLLLCRQHSLKPPKPFGAEGFWCMN